MPFASVRVNGRLPPRLDFCRTPSVVHDSHNGRASFVEIGSVARDGLALVPEAPTCTAASCTTAPTPRTTKLTPTALVRSARDFPSSFLPEHMQRPVQSSVEIEDLAR
jgi:hypothetical protein